MNILLALKELILLLTSILQPASGRPPERLDQAREVSQAVRGQDQQVQDLTHPGVPLTLLQQLPDQHPHRPGVWAEGEVLVKMFGQETLRFFHQRHLHTPVGRLPGVEVGVNLIVGDQVLGHVSPGGVEGQT